MILSIAAACGIGIVIGIVIERYKWVRSTKKGKFIEVDGDLYSVSKIEVTLKGKSDENREN